MHRRGQGRTGQGAFGSEAALSWERVASREPQRVLPWRLCDVSKQSPFLSQEQLDWAEPGAGGGKGLRPMEKLPEPSRWAVTRRSLPGLARGWRCHLWTVDSERDSGSVCYSPSGQDRARTLHPVLGEIFLGVSRAGSSRRFGKVSASSPGRNGWGRRSAQEKPVVQRKWT